MARGPNKSDPQAAVPAEDMVRSLARLLDETGLSEIEIEGSDRAAAQAKVEAMCKELLANPVIENYAIELE